MLKVDINLVFTIINLLILFVAMKIFLFKPVQNIIAKRQEEADEQFRIAKDKQDIADSLKEKYEQTIEAAEKEKKLLIGEAHKTADLEYKKIVESAQRAAENLKLEATNEAEAQKAQILKKAEKEIADLVVDATKKIVAKNKGEEVDIELYNQFLDKAGEEA